MICCPGCRSGSALTKFCGSGSAYNQCGSTSVIVAKKYLAYCTYSTHCRNFPYLKLCRPAYIVRTTQLLPHPSHEWWHGLHIMSFNVMTTPTTAFFICRTLLLVHCNVILSFGSERLAHMFSVLPVIRLVCSPTEQEVDEVGGHTLFFLGEGVISKLDDI